LGAWQESQRQLAQTHALVAQAMADSHAAYLRTTEVEPRPPRGDGRGADAGAGIAMQVQQVQPMQVQQVPVQQVQPSLMPPPPMQCSRA
jgi:hypothetical protein